MRAGAVLAVAVFVTVLLGGSRAAAQEATPPVLLPVTPDPSECTVEARTIDELLAAAGATPMAATPAVATDMEGAATPEAFALPEGEPADEATVAAIIATMREVIACINTGNFLYVFEFLTDEAFATFTAEPITEEEVEFLRASPPALESDQYASLLDVRAVTVLPDGRVGALVVTQFPLEEPDAQVDYFVFEQVDGRWLIAEIVEDLEDQFPADAATPAA